MHEKYYRGVISIKSCNKNKSAIIKFIIKTSADTCTLVQLYVVFSPNSYIFFHNLDLTIFPNTMLQTSICIRLLNLPSHFVILSMFQQMSTWLMNKSSNHLEFLQNQDPPMRRIVDFSIVSPCIVLLFISSNKTYSRWQQHMNGAKRAKPTCYLAKQHRYSKDKDPCLDSPSPRATNARGPLKKSPGKSVSAHQFEFPLKRLHVDCILRRSVSV